MDYLAEFHREREVAAARAAAIFAKMPEEALRGIWLALPVEARARCACVCRAWRDELADPALWTCLRPSCTRFWTAASVVRNALGATLRAAVAKAAGQLETLDLSSFDRSVGAPLLLDLVTANGGTLRELRVASLVDLGGPEGLLALLRAAPHLQSFMVPEKMAVNDVAIAVRMLRNEAVYRPLRLAGLTLDFRLGPEQAVLDVHALALAVAGHASLRKLKLRGLTARDVAALDALVDAALTRKLREFDLCRCTVPTAWASSLARLLEGGHVETFELVGNNTTEAGPFFDSAAVAVLAPALRSNIRLKNLCFDENRIWADPTAAAALFTSLASHPSLTMLSVCHDAPPAAGAVDVVAAAFAELVTANSALSGLMLCGHQLDDDFFAPLFDALPSSNRLRLLDLTGNRLSDAFMRDSVLPAVRANTSLNDLSLDNEHAAAHEAMDFVKLHRGW